MFHSVSFCANKPNMTIQFISITSYGNNHNTVFIDNITSIKHTIIMCPVLPSVGINIIMYDLSPVSFTVIFRVYNDSLYHITPDNSISFIHVFITFLYSRHYTTVLYNLYITFYIIPLFTLNSSLGNLSERF